MSDDKHSRRDRFTWSAGDIEIIKAPETKPARKGKPLSAAGQTDAAENEAPPPHKPGARGDAK